MATRTENFIYTHERKRGQLWIEWTDSLGTFTIHRNDTIPIWPMSYEETMWVRSRIKSIFGLGLGLPEPRGG